YPGGANLDSNGFNIRIAQIFADPTGSGVTSIPVVNGGSGYSAPPHIELVGGGKGATAIANLTNGVVSSITVTNPGVDYTAPPTVNVLGGGQGSGLTVGTPVIAANTVGNLVKKGPGSISLEGASLYTGTTGVEQGALLVNADHSGVTGTTHVSAAGTLGGAGIFGGQVTVSGTVNPGREVTGDTNGVLTTLRDVTFASGSKLAIDIDESKDVVSDLLNVMGNLDITHCALNVNLTGQAVQLPYVIATFGTRTGQFASVPAGVTVAYNENTIEITAIASTASPYQTWIGGHFPGETDPLIVGPGADPDHDGSTNLQEFALGSLPNSASARPRVHVIDKVMTIAVRQGTSAFEGSPSPTATTSGVTYNIEGSLDLGNFTSAVTSVAPVTLTRMK
ncbi:MAG: hypothetical protein EOP88_28055, partial [Verrucomicrobiaceae bacterium]